MMLRRFYSYEEMKEHSNITGWIEEYDTTLGPILEEARARAWASYGGEVPARQIDT